MQRIESRCQKILQMNSHLDNRKAKTWFDGEDVFTERDEIAFVVRKIEIEREQDEDRNKKSRAQVH